MDGDLFRGVFFLDRIRTCVSEWTIHSTTSGCVADSIWTQRAVPTWTAVLTLSEL